MSTCLCTHGALASCLSRTLESGLHMIVQSTLRIQLTVGTSVDQERGRGTGWLWIKYPEEWDVGEEPHFLLTPICMSAASMVDWTTIHALTIDRLVRCDYWLFSLFHIYHIHSLFLCMSQFMLIIVSITCTFLSLCFIVHWISNSLTSFCRMA